MQKRLNSPTFLENMHFLEIEAKVRQTISLKKSVGTHELSERQP
jgi:hypothetical protein